MVDFAATVTPIVIYVPDLEGFRDHERGLTVDLEAEAPGPLLRTTEEVAEALREPDAMRSEHAERYDRFVSAYCSLLDGQASARVVERVFGV